MATKNNFSGFFKDPTQMPFLVVAGWASFVVYGYMVGAVINVARVEIPLGIEHCRRKEEQKAALEELRRGEEATTAAEDKKKQMSE